MAGTIALLPAMTSIRPASAADFAAISAIDHSAHSHPWPSSVLKRYVEKPHCTWVLEVDGQVLAFAVNTLVADEAERFAESVSDSSKKDKIRNLAKQVNKVLWSFQVL